MHGYEVRLPEPRVEKEPGPTRVADERGFCEEMVEPSAAARDHNRWLFARRGGFERELEVGRVLVDGMAFDAPGKPNILGCYRVEVADKQIDFYTKGVRVIEPGVGCDHVAASGQIADHTQRRGVAPAEDHGRRWSAHERK
jgi:hypothetical protein